MALFASLQDRLKAAATAGLEQFDQAGHALASRAAAQGQSPAPSSSPVDKGKNRDVSGRLAEVMNARMKAPIRATSLDPEKSPVVEKPMSKVPLPPDTDPANIPLPLSPPPTPTPAASPLPAIPPLPSAVTSPTTISSPTIAPPPPDIAPPLKPVIVSDPLSELPLPDSTILQQASSLLRSTAPEALPDGLGDVDALRDWLSMVRGKLEWGEEEGRRHGEKMRIQESRMEELRDTHRLESTSSNSLINTLRDQLAASSSELTTLRTDAEKARSEATTLRGEIVGLKAEHQGTRAELAKAVTTAKEEEEKRGKAISLLKTVRGKNVKLEAAATEAERRAAEEKAERGRLAAEMEKGKGESQKEVERLKAGWEKEVERLRSGFEREVTGLREKGEREISGLKSKWELELITTKASHAKDLAQKNSRISQLESQLSSLNLLKGQQFDSLQSRQSELDAARGNEERVEARNKELLFQVKEEKEAREVVQEALGEARRRVEVLEEELKSAGGKGSANGDEPGGKTQSGGAQSNIISSADVTRLLADASSRSESKLSELRSQIARLERERLELEEESTRQIADRTREMERLRIIIAQKDAEYAESVKGKRERDEMISEVAAVRDGLRLEIVELQAKLEELRLEKSKVLDLEHTIAELKRAQSKELLSLQTAVEEAKTNSTQLRAANKTLRDEMRKLQSSVQLLEKQRNPGVGYWAAGSSGNGAASGGKEAPLPSSAAGVAMNGDGNGATKAPSPAPRSKTNDEEEVNLEYLRNVILQYLENPAMRPNLIRVMSIILRFTPQEQRRLQNKLTA